MQGEQYNFGYYDTNVYGHVVDLVRKFYRVDGAVHLDLGCGFGAIAESIEGLGLTYVGGDIQGPGRESLVARGFEAVELDLGDVAGLPYALEAALAGRSLASVSIIDTLEHITTGAEVLAAVEALARAHGAAPLIVAVPNVTHRDLGAKLMVGRWDYTDTGLLDRTHVIHHTEGLLTAMAEAAGWREVGQADFILAKSDQYFPTDLAVLGEQTTIGAFLGGLSAATNPHSKVNEFVRAYVPGRARPTSAGGSPTATPFLSVLVRTQGRRPEQLRDALLCLQGQTNHDFELIVLPHKVSIEQQVLVERLVWELPGDLAARSRVVPVDDGGRARPLNVGAMVARGRYISVFDDDDLVLGHWVDTFAVLAERRPGAVLRAVSVLQDIEECEWAGGTSGGHRTVTIPTAKYDAEFDLVNHLAENHSPLMSLAFPHSLFVDLNMRFDEDLNVMEDWDFFLRSALLCGVESLPTVTSVYRRWLAGEDSRAVHDSTEWTQTQRRIIERLDSQVHAWPAGTVSRLLLSARAGIHAPGVRESARAHHESLLGELRHELDVSQSQVEAMRASASWRVTRLMRFAGSLSRRGVRFGRRRLGVALRRWRAR